MARHTNADIAIVAPKRWLGGGDVARMQARLRPGVGWMEASPGRDVTVIEGQEAAVEFQAKRRP